MHASAESPCTGLILAGGRARRMQGRDKGLIPLHGRPLIAHALDTMQAVTTNILISANRHMETYAAYGHPIVRDSRPDYPGPLAGILSALESTPAECLAVMPCDCPLAPPALLSRLIDAHLCQGRLITTAHDGRRLQPTFAVVQHRTLDSLRAFLDAGQRTTREWIRSLQPAIVDCSEHPEWFANVNTPADVLAMERRLETVRD